MRNFILILIGLFGVLGFNSFTNNKNEKAKSITIVKPSNKSSKTEYGIASYYHDMFDGRLTSTGEIFRQDSLFAAHKTMKLGSIVKVTNLVNNNTVIVKVNDRLPPNSKRTIDLAKRAARELNFIKAGLTKVKIEIIGKAS
jgi:rare lipoprotein A